VKKKPKTGGRLPGSQNFTPLDRERAFKAILKIKPYGANKWKETAIEYNRMARLEGRKDRDGEWLKKYYDDKIREGINKPACQPITDWEIRRANEVKSAIDKSIHVGDLGDDPIIELSRDSRPRTEDGIEGQATVPLGRYSPDWPSQFEEEEVDGSKNTTLGTSGRGPCATVDASSSRQQPSFVSKADEVIGKIVTAIQQPEDNTLQEAIAKALERSEARSERLEKRNEKLELKIENLEEEISRLRDENRELRIKNVS
jgi:hypothetical protein